MALPGKIEAVYVLPLRNKERTQDHIDEAIASLLSIDESAPGEPFVRYEVGVRYSNGDAIHGQFNDKATAIRYLRGVR